MCATNIIVLIYFFFSFVLLIAKNYRSSNSKTLTFSMTQIGSNWFGNDHNPYLSFNYHLMRISEWFYNIAPLLCIFLLSSQLETFIATAPTASMLSSIFNFDTIYATHTHTHSLGYFTMLWWWYWTQICHSFGEFCNVHTKRRINNGMKMQGNSMYGHRFTCFFYIRHVNIVGC